jgi:hypothetical protein
VEKTERMTAKSFAPSHRLLDHLRDGDVVVVWKLDRLSRSLKDLLHIMEKIGGWRRLPLAHRLTSAIPAQV